MQGSSVVKYCKHCGRLNPLDTLRCISCQYSEFEPVQLVPKWLEEFGRDFQKRCIGGNHGYRAENSRV